MASSFEIETQEQQNWCWAAVAASVSNYFFPDQEIEQCDIANSVLNGNCCNDGQMETCDKQESLVVNDLLVGTSLTCQAMFDTCLDFKTVRQKIDASLPVCVRILWYGEEGRGHFVIIKGYSLSQAGEPWVDIADPYYEDSTVPYEQFRSAYWGAGKWSDTYLVNQS